MAVGSRGQGAVIRTPTHGQAVRCLRLAHLLLEARSGATVSELLHEQQCGRATLYRDLDLLREAGWLVQEKTENGLTVYSVRRQWRTVNSLSSRALVALARTGPIQAYDLAAQMNCDPHRLSVALLRLANNGQVQRLARGMYALPGHAEATVAQKQNAPG